MTDNYPPVWECEYSLDVNACPESVWQVLEDVDGWPSWNEGLEKIELLGPFEAGSSLITTFSDRGTVTSLLREVQRKVGFLDETRVGELRIFVDHRIAPIGDGRARVVFSVEAFGPGCDKIGPQFSANFPETLRNLAQIAECRFCTAILERI